MQGELPWAMAKDGVFPPWLARLSSRGTPVRAHVVASLAVLIGGLTLLSTAVSVLWQ